MIFAIYLNGDSKTNDTAKPNIKTKTKMVITNRLPARCQSGIEPN